MKKDGFIYSPPAWRVCPTCRGQRIEYDESPCRDCIGTGRIPIYYTPEQWQEAGGVLNKDTPCWARFEGEDWDLLEYASVLKTEKIIIATEAGIPPMKRTELYAYTNSNIGKEKQELNLTSFWNGWCKNCEAQGPDAGTAIAAMHSWNKRVEGEKISAFKAEIERKDAALRKITKHGEEMEDYCEMAFGTKNIAEQALSKEK